jgi:hypothetical protein
MTECDKNAQILTDNCHVEQEVLSPGFSIITTTSIFFFVLSEDSLESESWRMKSGIKVGSAFKLRGRNLLSLLQG